MKANIHLFSVNSDPLSRGYSVPWERFLCGDWSTSQPQKPGWYVVVNQTHRVCGFIQLKKIKGEIRIFRDVAPFNYADGAWKGWYWNEPFPDPLSHTFPFIRLERTNGNKSNGSMSGGMDDTCKTGIHKARVVFIPEPLHELPGRVAQEWERFLTGYWTRATPTTSGIWITANHHGGISGQMFTFNSDNSQDKVFQRSALHAFEPTTDCWRWSVSLPLYFPKRIQQRIDPNRQRLDNLGATRAPLRVVHDSNIDAD